MKAFLTALAVLFIAATVLPLVRHSAWWIRIFDFPRAQIFVAGLVVTGLYFFFWDRKSIPQDAVIAALVLCVAYQAFKMIPYTFIAREQVKSAEIDANEGTTISLLIANVFMDNRESDRFLELVGEYDPDILLAVETDRWWVERLSALSEKYPYVVSVPLPNTYGMILLSRLELISPQVKYLVSDSIPSIHAHARLRDDVEIMLYCVHPRPPYPSEDTDTKQRDAELLIVGREVRSSDEAVIVMGDLNDVAWSYTTSLFQRISGLLDPRIGRGMYSTFHADYPIMRWPLDHIFHSDDFRLIELVRLPSFGSDHFPMFAALQYSERAATEQEEPAAEPEDERAADKKIDEGNETE